MAHRHIAIARMDYSFEEFLNSLKVEDLTDSNLEAKAQLFVDQLKKEHGMIIEWRWSNWGGIEFY